MRILIRIILGLFAIGVIAFAIVMFFSSGARDQARGFVEDMSVGNYQGATERLHAQLQQQLGETGLQEMFEGSEGYVEVTFNSISVENNRSELSGSATTPSGCVSEVDFVLIGGQIVNFSFTPLCPASN